jgi:hypothetical protein
MAASRSRGVKVRARLASQESLIPAKQGRSERKNNSAARARVCVSVCIYNLFILIRYFMR